jgi:hypothetical protein
MLHSYASRDDLLQTFVRVAELLGWLRHRSSNLVEIQPGVSRGSWLNFGQGLGKRIFSFGGFVIHLQTDPESIG